jgi:hypothetical protein
LTSIAIEINMMYVFILVQYGMCQITGVKVKL